MRRTNGWAKLLAPTVSAILLAASLAACRGGSSSPSDADTATGSASVQQLARSDVRKINDAFGISLERAKTTVSATWEASGHTTSLVSYDGAKPAVSVKQMQQLQRVAIDLADERTKHDLKFADPAYQDVKLLAQPVPSVYKRHFIIVSSDQDLYKQVLGASYNDASRYGFTIAPTDAEWSVTFLSPNRAPTTDKYALRAAAGTEMCQQVTQVKLMGPDAKRLTEKSRKLLELVGQETACNSVGQAWASAKKGRSYDYYRSSAGSQPFVNFLGAPLPWPRTKRQYEELGAI